MAEEIKDLGLVPLPGRTPAPSTDGIGAALAAAKPAASTVVSGTKEKLMAVAKGGAEGLKNYQASHDFLSSQRNMALQRANERASLIGGPEAQGYEAFTEGEFARRSADIASADKAASQAGSYRQAAIANYRKGIQAGIPAAAAFGREQGAAKAKAATKEDFIAKALGQAELDEQTAAGNVGKAQGDIDTLNKEREGLDFTVKQTQSVVDGINERLKKVDKEWEKAENTKGALIKQTRPKKEIEADQQRLREQRHRVLGNLHRYEAELGNFDKTKGEQIKTRQGELDTQQSTFTPETRADRAREIAIRQMNVAPSLAYGKIGVEDVKSRLPKPEASDAAILGKANISAPQLKAVKDNPDYQRVFTQLSGAVSVLSKEEALQAINLVKDPQVRAVLRAQLEGEFLTASQLKTASGKK